MSARRVQWQEESPVWAVSKEAEDVSSTEECMKQILKDDIEQPPSTATIQENAAKFLAEPCSSAQADPGSMKEEMHQAVSNGEGVDSVVERFEAAAEDYLANLIKSGKVVNTEYNTNWDKRCLEEFRDFWWNKHKAIFPELTEMTSVDLDLWLQRFFYGAKQKEEKEYSPKTLYDLACGLSPKKRREATRHPGRQGPPV